jgi:hypothetical protein
MRLASRTFLAPVAAAWLLAGCTTVHHHHHPSPTAPAESPAGLSSNTAATPAAKPCDPVGRWTIGDHNFEIARAADGTLYISNAAQNEKASLHAEGTDGACELTIQVTLYELPMADFTHSTYELYERNGTVEGSLVVCDFDEDFEGDPATASCPPEAITTSHVSGTRSPPAR